MARNRSGSEGRAILGNGSIEHELTLHLERAHELARRAEASNCLLQEQLRRAQEIADELTGRVEPHRNK